VQLSTVADQLKLVVAFTQLKFNTTASRSGFRLFPVKARVRPGQRGTVLEDIQNKFCRHRALRKQGDREAEQECS